jgi:hypothetical protein
MRMVLGQGIAMLIYWVPFVTLAIASFSPLAKNTAAALFAAGFLILWIGLRHEVGADWGPYSTLNQEVIGANLLSALGRSDPAYALLNWLGANGLSGIYFVNLACAALAVVPLIIFCRRQPNPALALLVAIPYLVTVVYMNYTRQSVALGFGLLAMLAVQDRKLWRFVAFVTVAALFHKTAVCLVILAPALFSEEPPRAWVRKFIIVAVWSVVLTVFLFANEFQMLTQEYITNTGDAALASRIPLVGEGPSRRSGTNHLYSAGAVVRIAQSVVAVACIVFICLRTPRDPATTWLWSIMSIAVILLFILAFWRSTLADRFALFFVPLQLYAFATLPSLFKPPLARAVQLAIILGSASAFFVWLNYGSDTQAWLPYRSVIGTWL